MNLVFQQMYLKTAVCIGFGKFLQVVPNTCRSKVQPDTRIIVMLARRHPPRNVLVAKLRYGQFSRSAVVQYNILLLFVGLVRNYSAETVEQQSEEIRPF